jgi:ABC-type antimicrobial peptide transport system permease subunit
LFPDGDVVGRRIGGSFERSNEFEIVGVVGVVLGLGAALWAGRFVKTVVYGLSAHDALTITTAVTLIALVSALAGYLPARSAANVDPMVALRDQ